MKIFVYGTLMKGLQRARALSRSQFIAHATTTGELYDLGRFPALIAGHEKVLGEVYEISEQILHRLDQIESYDPENPEKSLYIRKEIAVYLDSNSHPVTAEGYFYNRCLEGRSTVISSGDYRVYLEKQGILNLTDPLL